MTTEENIQLYERFRDLLKEGGFNLRKFVTSNSDNTEYPDSLGEVHKALGINWNVANDKLIIDLRAVVEEANVIDPMKRHVVSVISKIFDLLGLVSPITIRLKIFLQDLHSSKISWNSYVTGDLLS